MFIILFWLGSDVPALLLSILMPLFLVFVCLSYFILVVPMHVCLGEHSCISSQFPVAILNCTFFSQGEIVLALAEASPIKI